MENNEEFEGIEEQEQQEETRTETIPEGDYKNIAEMSDEDLSDWQSEDPKGYAANLARQIREEVGKERDISAFARDHEDFINLHRSGILNDVIKSNPTLKGNLISAYYVHKYHDGRLTSDYISKHGVTKVLGDRLSERRGVRKSQPFGESDCQPTMPDDM